jgi:adenylylsulfate kinase-like enzyme
MPNPNHAAHQLAVAQAEAVRQTSKKTNNTASGHKAADIAFYTAVLASGKANNIATGAKAALQSLGVDVQALDGNI